MAVTRYLGGSTVVAPAATTVEGQFNISTLNVVTTSLTADRVASDIGGVNANESTYMEMIVTRNGFNLDLPAAWDPETAYVQPASDVFVLAIRLLPGGAIRFVGAY